ncbi:hypothetical protein EVAR_42892_1 [Eumeta japonica]|uniref:Uncharacterized protein n=1 Tax=Eumeta variegata TaxID=151549 RepID=A0A4C1YG65_EUMVA|nr:hypothetical protein EVAR_42892_1 [Eumeta japonica]
MPVREFAPTHTINDTNLGVAIPSKYSDTECCAISLRRVLRDIAEQGACAAWGTLQTRHDTTNTGLHYSLTTSLSH